MKRAYSQNLQSFRNISLFPLILLNIPLFIIQLRPSILVCCSLFQYLKITCISLPSTSSNTHIRWIFDLWINLDVDFWGLKSTFLPYLFLYCPLFERFECFIYLILSHRFWKGYLCLHTIQWFESNIGLAHY